MYNKINNYNKSIIKNTLNNNRKNLHISMKNAKSICAKSPNSDSCASAYDHVEDLARAVYKQKQKLQKLSHQKTELDSFCEYFPEADECKIYDI